jgi:type IV pilus assembly protein PilM
MPALRRSGGTAVALDIGSSRLTAAVVRRGKAGPRLAKVASRPLPPQLVVGGVVADPAELGQQVKRLWREESLPGRRVRLGVANQRVSARTLEMPHITDRAELRAAVEFEAGDHIPIPLHEAVLDYVVLPRGEVDPEAPDQVMIVAAQRDMVQALSDTVRRAGLRPHGVDLEAFALVRALLPAEAGGGGGAQVICDVGAEFTNVVIAVGRQAQFTRLVGFAGSELTAAVAERTGLPEEQAEALKVACGLLGDLGEECDMDQVREVRHALALGARPLVEEIRRSLEFYRSQGIARPIERIVLTGGTSGCVGLDRYLQQALGIPVVLGNPLANLASGELDSGLAARSAVAIGLALDLPEAA